MKVQVEVVGLSRWSCEGIEFAAGTHDLDVDAGMVAALAAAEAAGSLHIIKADPQARKVIDKAVEPDEDSQKKLAAAVEDGSWQRGNLHAFITEREQIIADCQKHLKTADPEEAERLGELAARMDVQVEQAKRTLSELEA